MRPRNAAILLDGLSVLENKYKTEPPTYLKKDTPKKVKADDLGKWL